MHSRICKSLLICGVAAVLTACETTTDKTDEEAETPAPVEDQSASSMPAPPSPGFQGTPIDDPTSLLSTKVIYFDYDSSDIGIDSQPVVEAHGSFLANNASVSVTLEGHADERGSREYNIALGERRGNSVRQLMTLIGASASQIRVVSYGEERPAVDGHDEMMWSQNRRVEIIYRLP